MMKFNLLFRKYILFWALLAMVIGYLAGKFNRSRVITLQALVLPLLFVMIFIMVFPSRLSNLVQLKSYLTPAALSVLLFLLSPFIAYGIASIIPEDFRFLRTGIIIAATVPPDAMLSAWAGFLEGDILLTLIIQSLTFLLWIFLVPFGLSLFFGNASSFSMPILLKNLFLLIVIPFALAVIIKRIIRKLLETQQFIRIKPTFSSISGIIEIFIILISIALHAKIISDFPIIILWGVLTAALFYTTSFIVAIILTRITHVGWDNSIPLIYENGTKNLSIAMVISLTSFKGQTILGIAACMLVQFPVAALFYSLMGSIAYSNTSKPGR